MSTFAVNGGRQAGCATGVADAVTEMDTGVVSTGLVLSKSSY